MLDFVVYDLQNEVAVFFDLFICSSVTALFELRDVNTIVGEIGCQAGLRGD